MLPFRSVKNFYPRPPRGGRPPAVARGYPSAKISIHALREEGDVGGDPALGLFGISIHALREEGDAGPQLRERPERISIHALREEGDEEGPKVFRLKTNFYPRPPRGGRPLTVRLSALPRSFLSTPSARRATSASLPCRSPARFLSTPSARRATYLLTVPPTSIKISIHALREEGDDVGVDDVVHIARFLSTPSARRATRASSTATSTCSYFYPRPPRGGRLSPSCVYALHWKFLSTPSARRATKAIDDYTMQLIISIHALREEGDRRRPHQRPAGGISIHALREEGDPIVFRLYLKLEVFLSTPSARRATCMRQEQNSSICISIHALREEGDPTTPVTVRCMFLFLSTPSARRATMSGQGSFVPTEDFYPRPPRGGRRLLICAADLGGHISIHALREEGDEKAQD